MLELEFEFYHAVAKAFAIIVAAYTPPVFGNVYSTA